MNKNKIENENEKKPKKNIIPYDTVFIQLIISRLRKQFDYMFYF